MAEVERTGRTALEEMRRLLGLLRPGEDDPPIEDADYAPTLGLADLPALADRIRGAGLTVTLSVATEPAGEVPQDMGLTVYRVVQEALTNALRHAGPAASACVTVGCRDGVLDVEVTDDGRGAAADLAGGGLPGDVCVFVCGEPAFMQGARYTKLIEKRTVRKREESSSAVVA